MTAYVLDPTGALAANLVSNETQPLVANPTGFYNLIVPTNGPFFVGTLVVKAVLTAAANTTTHALNQSITLVKWVDYVPALIFSEATELSGRSVYAGIVLTDLTMAGQLTLTYQALGGTYQLTPAQISALLSSTTLKPLTTDLSGALGLTTSFGDYTPVFDSTNQSTSANLQTVVNTGVSQAQGTSPLYSPLDFSLHYNNQNNPHQDTALTYGLDKVPNWGTATQADVAAATSRSLFLTPYSTAAATKSTSNIPNATTTVAGLTKLNLGGIAGDDVDASKSLTTQGLVNLRNSGTANAIKSLAWGNRQQFFFTPSPLVYPCSFNGYGCYNFNDLLLQVGNYLGIKNVQGSQTLGCFWIPADVPIGTVSLNTQPSFGFGEGGGAPFDLGLFSV